MMLKRRKNNFPGQSTLELAMVLPIACGLIFWLLYGFRLHHWGADKSIRLHADTLKAFNHGNSGTIRIDGIEVVPGRYSAIVPIGSGIDLGDLLKSVVPNLALQLGLNQLFQKVPFFQKSTYASGATAGFISGAANSWVASGYQKVDLRAASWSAAAGAFSSDDAAKDLRKTDRIIAMEKFDSWDFWGSAGQAGLVAFTKSEGDWKSIVPGAVGGMLSSQTAKNYLIFNNGNDVLSGAARGAITSSVAGVFGGNFDIRQVGIASAMGAFNSKTFASKFAQGNWSGDPRGAASFGAASAAFSTLLTGGNLEDAAYASAAGAFSSGQVQLGTRGKTHNGWDWAQSASANAGFTAATSWARGSDLESIAWSAANSGIGAGAAWGMSQAYGKINPAVTKAIEGAGSPPQAIDQISKESGDAEGMSYASEYDENVNRGLYDPAAEVCYANGGGTCSVPPQKRT